jgi:hypothetical protein
MGIKFNPFTSNFDLAGSSDAAPFAGQVNAYTDLPLDSTAALNSRWLVKNNSGTWPFSSYKQAGIYIRVNTAGVSRDTDYQFVGTLPSVMNDNEFLVYDDADATKNLKFQLSSITTGTTRTLTVPNKSGTLATTDAGDMASGTLADARLSSNVPLKDAANTFTQNQTLNGTNNVAPNQTAASGSSVMTRDLVDVRNTALWVPIGGRPNNAQANGSNWAFVPWGVATAGECYLIPVTHKNLAAMYINIAFTGAPIAATFAVDLFFGNSTGSNAAANPTTQTLTGTVTQVSGNRYKWVLNAATTLTPANDDGGAYYLNSANFVNNSGGSLTTVAGNVQTQGYMLITP